jgi:archaeal flagellin FlaB
MMFRKAEMGVGTLIIFIALLLVAAVAAGVLIQTAGSLQQRALSTGTQATGQISTNAVTLEVSAVDGTTAMENFSAVMKLAPGSDPIELDSVTYTLGTKNSTTTYTYSGAATFSVDSGNQNGTFGVTYLQQGTNYQSGVLVRGDVIRLELQAPRSIGAGEDVRLSFIPKTGTPTLTVFTVPDVISTQRVYLYP